MYRTLTAMAMAGLLVGFGSAHAADFEPEREIGLIVSGVADNWIGAQFMSGPIEGPFPPGSTTDDWYGVTGGEGLLSLPAGENLSIQSDFKYEYNGNAFRTTRRGDVIGPEYMFQGAFHLSWRDPMSHLFGFFGGVGEASVNSLETVARFVGGEGQFYWGDFTFYAQGGYVDFVVQDSIGPGFLGLDEGFFVRGVARWFPTADSRLQLEGTYLNADFSSGFVGSPSAMEAFAVKARYDFTLGSLPIVGAVPVYLAYRGIFRQNCSQEFTSSTDINDHTIMIGSAYTFSGDRITVDRYGATLDTPDFYYSCLASSRTFNPEED